MFTKPNIENLHIIEGQYDIWIVALSFVIAFVASFTAVFINRHMKEVGFFHKNVWLILASLAMGLGIWSMHFVGMSAYKLPIPMEHNMYITLLSIIPAVIASYIAFYLTNSTYKKLTTYVLAGIFMGLGIATMHYVGMAAMQIDAYYVYDATLFFISVVVAIVASLAALYIFSITNAKMNRLWIKLLVALLMAIAVTSMHYIGMLAIEIYVENPIEEHVHHEHTMNMQLLVAFVTVGIMLLFSLAYLVGKLDKYVNYRVKNFDALTQLPNQNQFMEDQQLHKSTQLVAIIHLHNLEKYISMYGYTFGDVIIKNVEELIISMLPKEAKVYRTEANRFTIVQIESEATEKILLALERICLLMERSLLINSRMITVDMVCAVSQASETKPIHEHFSNAIAVLQSPTIQFKHEVIMYNPKLHTFNFERQLSLDIQRAMDEDELFIVYQPKVDPIHSTVIGVEALIRWKHPDFGFVSPGIFIPILESGERIADVTDWIIEKVCEQLVTWNESNIQMNQVSINIPGVYLTSTRLSHVLNECLLKNRINPSQIELEITETSVIHDIDNAILAVRKFRDKGLSVALDDFGTGLSSLSYLKEIPISTIKIDKSFVDGVPKSKKDAAILKSIVDLSYSLDLNVVIEGVETADQIQFISTMQQVPAVQGYYYSKPLTATEFEDWSKQQQLIVGH